MKYKIIQVTATDGFIVPHSIKTVLQYICDCLGKRSITKISKIIAFGPRETQTSSLRSPYTHNEWLFGADFDTVASWGHFSLKMNKEPPLRSIASVTMTCSTNFCFRKLKALTWTTFGFNRTGPFATQPTWQSIFCAPFSKIE